MKKVINGKLYDTSTATEIATNEVFDGSNWDQQGRTSILYTTKKGNYFVHYKTRWQGEHDNLHPVDIEEAKEIYESMIEQTVEYKEAFPGCKVETA